MRQRRPSALVTLLLSVLLTAAAGLARQRSLTAAAPAAVPVGVVLDMGTLVGKMCWASLSVAVEDFYAAHPNYTTRLALHLRDAQADVVGAGSAVLGLVKNDGVKAILGPQKSAQARFLSDIANKTQIPLIAFTATSPALSFSTEPYFLRAALNDSCQTGAVAAVVRSFGWREVVPIYEDTDYGNGVIPYLIDALQAVDVRVPHRSVISPSASDDQILKELYMLMTMQTRVFVVHMSLPVGARLFSKATAAGMVTKGYAWIMSDGIASLVDSIDRTALGAMQGFLGVRPYVAETPELDAFTLRWKRRYRRDNPDAEKDVEPSIYSVWAYDAMTALALAVERLEPANFTFQNPVILENSTDLDALPVSPMGPEILEALLRTSFAGLGGAFRLADGQLESSAYQIVNVAGTGHKEVGYWTPGYGISRQVKAPGSLRRNYSTSEEEMGSIVWPGDTTEVPRGWEIPSRGKKLRVAVPVREGFFEFVKVETDPATKAPTVKGYCIDIFDKAMASLPYAVPFEYIPYLDIGEGFSRSYDELVKQVPLGRFDAVAGDVTILADRYQYVDFTLPYSESGVYMIVPLTEDKKMSAWIFLKPLTTELWLAILGGFALTGFAVWVGEHGCDNEHFKGSPQKVTSNVLYFSFSTLVFAQKQELKSSLSRAVVIVWSFVVLILTASYTASLSSRLTVKQLLPALNDMDQLIKSGRRVGYREGSFLQGRLRQQFGESRMVALSGSDEYAAALSNGTVAAVFHELPYVKLFLKKYCKGYTMIGPTQRTAGLGFVFPKHSPLLSDVSAAVLKVTQGPDMKDIDRKWMETNSTCQDQDGSSNVASGSRLTFYSLRGLFFITGVTSISALLIFYARYLRGRSKKVAPSMQEGNDAEPRDHQEHSSDDPQAATGGVKLGSTPEEDHPPEQPTGDSQQHHPCANIHQMAIQIAERE